jgi:hypothetical protein
MYSGNIIAQAFSNKLMLGAWIEFQATQMEFVVDKSGTVVGLSHSTSTFPSQLSFHQCYISIRGCDNGPMLRLHYHGTGIHICYVLCVYACIYEITYIYTQLYLIFGCNSLILLQIIKQIKFACTN